MTVPMGNLKFGQKALLLLSKSFLIYFNKTYHIFNNLVQIISGKYLFSRFQQNFEESFESILSPIQDSSVSLNKSSF